MIERKLELDIRINSGSVVIRNDNTIEIVDCNNLTIEQLEYNYR